MPERRKRSTEGAQEQKVRVRLEQGSLNRVIWADGAWGGITSQGNIHMALYSEFRALPTELEVTERHAEIHQEIIEDPGVITRQIEAQVILSPQVAEALMKWLGEKLKDTERFRTEIRRRQGDVGETTNDGD